jgi:hypothetical protein
MQVWVEWLCSRCNELHRACFEVVVTDRLYMTRNRYRAKTSQTWGHDEIFIEDVALREKIRKRVGLRGKAWKGSRIIVEYYTSVQKILSVLDKYMNEFYSIQPNTLKMEVCP